MRQFVILTALLAAPLQSGIAQEASYPAAEVVGEFRSICANVTDVSALRERAARRGWIAASPPADLVDDKNPVPGRAGEYTLDTDDQRIFYLGRKVAGRSLWLMVMDMRFAFSDGGTGWHACAVLDQGAPRLALSDAARLFGREPTVKETPFHSTQFRWEPAATEGAAYTTIDYCAQNCVIVSGLVFESGIQREIKGGTSQGGMNSR